MKKQIIVLLLFVCSISANAQVRGPRRAANAVLPASSVPINSAVNTLPIRRVILYSNGVAYIERRGIVTGNAEVNLSFKQSQVDDVLKSMIVLDLGQGKIGAVSYNSSAPISSRMSEIPFSVDPVSMNAGGVASVLAQLQGAKVLVTSTKGTASGSILTLERKSITVEKETQTTTILVIASESGEISSFDLRDVKSVKMLEDGTRKDINEFANAAASARRLDAKTITVTSQGSGQREMVVSYTIAAPIWKTTYRVVLDEAGQPFFQGWAIVDNVSEEDWQSVQMSLVSGSPISFIQNLQKPFYRYRPVVPMPEDLQLEPQVYEPQSGNGSGRGDLPVNGRLNEDLPKGTNFGSLLKIAPNVKPEGLSGGFQIDGSSGTENTFILKDQVKISDALTGGNSGVQTAAIGDEIGDLFQYNIEQPVTVERNRSALIPIVQTKMEGERVSVYNEGVRADRPFSGVLLKNGTKLTLEAGSMTVIDGNAYAGEALMERLKPKEQRLISFALDLGTHVKVRNTGESEPARIIKAVDGVLQFHYYRSDQRTYEISNQTERAKVMYIEYPIRDGWQLSEDSPKPDYSTQKYYRFRVELGPLEDKKLKISVRQPLMESYQLTTLNRVDLQMFFTKGYINDETRARLEKIIDIRSQLAQIEARLNGFDDEVEKIEEDQKRLRENIEALSKTPEAKTLIARYIAKANDQETRLEEMEKERKALNEQKLQLARDLAAAIRSFEVK